jgi:hypothetical protein
MYSICNECLYQEPVQKTIERVFHDSPHLQPDGKPKQQIIKPSKLVSDMFESATFLGPKEEEIFAEIKALPLTRMSKYPDPTTTQKIKPKKLRLDEDLYRLQVSKDKEIIKSWITDKKVPNRIWSPVLKSIVKIDPDIPDEEDRRLLAGPNYQLLEDYDYTKDDDIIDESINYDYYNFNDNYL